MKTRCLANSRHTRIHFSVDRRWMVTWVALCLGLSVGCGELGAGHIDDSGDAEVDAADDETLPLSSRGTCVVAPNPVFVSEGFDIIGSRMNKDREARVDVNDTNGTQSIAARTDRSGGLRVTASSQTVGVAHVSVYLLTNKGYLPAAACPFEVVAQITCGDNACELGEDCSTCPEDCDVCPASCGDGECNGEESCSVCPEDCDVCPASCGDGECNGEESCSLCPEDCGPCDDSCGGAVVGGNICEAYQVCDGQILAASDTARCCSGECKLPKSFSWRNRHGEDWNTPVKDQGSYPMCPVFGGLVPVESAINLYFNRHLDVDLSEAAFVCGVELFQSNQIDFNINPCINIQSPASVACMSVYFGIPTESCFPYDSYSESAECSMICDDHEQRRWVVGDNFTQLLTDTYRTTFVLDDENNVVYEGPLMDRLRQVSLTKESLQEHIVRYGPVSAHAVLPGHTAAIVGWDSVTGWIVKNSWGTTDWDDGYFSTAMTAPEFGVIGVVQGSVLPPAGTSYEIRCVDTDGDSFCQWGISEDKPATCPASCSAQPDWDDSDPAVGALGKY